MAYGEIVLGITAQHITAQHIGNIWPRLRRLSKYLRDLSKLYGLSHVLPTDASRTDWLPFINAKRDLTTLKLHIVRGPNTKAAAEPWGHLTARRDLVAKPFLGYCPAI